VPTCKAAKTGYNPVSATTLYNMDSHLSRPWWIVAHRGASAYEPENTLRAFRRAMEQGAEMSELDLHLSKDGALIVMHNATVDQTTNGHGAIRELTLAQIQRLDAGQGERVPTLPEVIDLVRGRHGLYIELKAEGTPRPTVDLLRANSMTAARRDTASSRRTAPPRRGAHGGAAGMGPAARQVIVGSFDAALVRETKELAPELSVSLLVGPVYPAQELIELARAARADYVHLCWENRAPQPHKLLTPELLQALREAGLGIVLWHEERDDELSVLRTLDVDAICTNTPDKLSGDMKHGAPMPSQTNFTSDNILVRPSGVRPHAARAEVPKVLGFRPESPTSDPDLIVSVTPERAGWELISFQARRLAAGKRWSFQTGANELALVDFCGVFSVQSNRGDWQDIGGRADVFAGAGHVLYLPRHTEFTVTAKTNCEFAVASAPTDQDHGPFLTLPHQVQTSIRGGDNVSRQINDILPPGSPVHRLVLVEVYTPGGNWSSYPPHKHDVHRVDANGNLLEADLEEVYFYKFDKAGGYAYQRVYTDERSPLHQAGHPIDALVRADDNCAVLIPEGYHPVVGAPGYTTYYLNVLAGSAQSLANVDDPRYSWVKNTYKGTDPRLPLY
jgi:5-deoxy-glucuronate isomerase